MTEGKLDFKAVLIGILNNALREQGLGDCVVVELSDDFQTALVRRVVKTSLGLTIEFTGTVMAETILPDSDRGPFVVN